MMQITDIRAIADICHERRAAGQAIDLSVDNTFMSPYFQRPIEFGADIVMHSTTKFLNGHSDGLGGVLVATTPQHKESFEFVQKCTGGILSPFECFLVLRGVKTLAVRMKQHEVNGYAIANYLGGSPEDPGRFFIPGFPKHPQHALAQRQMSGFGALITFETGSLDNANAVLAPAEDLHCRRIAGRGGDIGFASRHHDSCGAGRGRPGQNRLDRRNGAYLRWYRRC